MTTRQAADRQTRSGHQPVMAEETLAALAIKPEGCYVDGTFGRGGHSRLILERLAGRGKLIAIDRDPEALAEARSLRDPRLIAVGARFSELDAVRNQCAVGRVDGVLFDLGVSSPQLDDPQRGFSFRSAGPLDMRMDPQSGQSARQWLGEADESDIARVLKEYGEERLAVPIAKAIAARLRRDGESALRTTTELAELVAAVVRRRRSSTAPGRDPATRTFQAIRIFINQELVELEDGLAAARDRLAPEGRLAVISFHSLEDRIVKRFIAHESGANAARDPITGERATVARTMLPVGRWLPTPAEANANPRARSAVLSAAQRL
ncbi:MAG: 16S rRNA (cytosine(1402)-N(4))-methyltransferase RsmH [Betaproteobacteria bacterium]